eukprot:403331202
MVLHKMINFKLYSLISALITFITISNSIQKYETFYNIVVHLTSQKVNLVIFFNFLSVVLINFINLLVWVFFDQIRTIESKYIMDKSQKKLFHFLLLTLILRSTFDIYKFLSLSILFSFWVLHWLIYKRSDYLISRGSRGRAEHAKLMVLYNFLIVIDFLISFTFYEKFLMKGERMNEIYVIIGFEFFRLFLKSVQDSFKYSISLVELYYREQWTEKGFVFNIISFLFDVIILCLNMKLFAYIISRQQFPLYLLGEIIDNFVRLGKSVQLFIQSRTLINKLKKLPNVSQEDLVGMDNTCIICLEEIKKAKKLSCGHIFHLNCLRRWLEQNVQCPTCRCKIELELSATQLQTQQLNQAAQERENARAVIQAQRAQNLRRRRIRRQIEEEETKQEIINEIIKEESPDKEESTLLRSLNKANLENLVQEEEEFQKVITPQKKDIPKQQDQEQSETIQSIRAKRLAKLKQELKETDQMLEELTNDLIEQRSVTKMLSNTLDKQDLENKEEIKAGDENERSDKKTNKTSGSKIVDSASKIPPIKRSTEKDKSIQDLFKIDEDEILDMIEEQDLKLQGKSLMDLVDDIVGGVEGNENVSGDNEDSEELKVQNNKTGIRRDDINEDLFNVSEEDKAEIIGRKNNSRKVKQSRKSLLKNNEFEFAKTINNTLFENHKPTRLENTELYSAPRFNPFAMKSKSFILLKFQCSWVSSIWVAMHCVNKKNIRCHAQIKAHRKNK